MYSTQTHRHTENEIAKMKGNIQKYTVSFSFFTPHNRLDGFAVLYSYRLLTNNRSFVLVSRFSFIFINIDGIALFLKQFETTLNIEIDAKSNNRYHRELLIVYDNVKADVDLISTDNIPVDGFLFAMPSSTYFFSQFLQFSSTSVSVPLFYHHLIRHEKRMNIDFYVQVND